MKGDSQGILRDLGRRLREQRERGGWTLSELARSADVSRRYLTEAEAGRANPTVLVLARLAEALGVELAALLASEPRATERVALVGLRGAGKSSVGRALARLLEAPFVELDDRVERLAGLRLAEIFELHGPEVFHRFEAEALEEVLAEGDRLVLATGGSLVDQAATFERLRATCRTVWLRAEPELHFRRVRDQGDERPMRGNPRAMEELRTILRRRAPSYSQAEVTVDTSELSVDEVVERIRAAVRA